MTKREMYLMAETLCYIIVIS